MSSIEVTHLTKTYAGSVNALSEVDLSVRSGELLVLLGPSGCGKSTLLRCIAGLERPTRGSIAIEGQVVADAGRRRFVPAHKRDIGMVFQSFTLFPHMTVERNVRYPLAARRRDTGSRKDLTRKVLELVHCAHLSQRYPGQLSGGQQQRVALARALCASPQVLLLDEPLSALDALLRKDLKEQLRILHRELSYTGVYVTHDQSEALALGTRVAVMREGKIEQIADPETVFQRPATEYVAEFLGIRNRLDVVREGDTWVDGEVRISGRLEEGLHTRPDRCTVYLRPSDLRLGSPVGAVADDEVDLGRGRIHEVLYQGRENEYLVQMGQKLLCVVGRRLESASVGDNVRVACRASDILIYHDGALAERVGGAPTTVGTANAGALS